MFIVVVVVFKERNRCSQYLLLFYYFRINGVHVPVLSVPEQFQVSEP